MKRLLFQELGEINSYDGIWACSSILHLPKRERNGRHFTDFTGDSFQDFIKEVPEIMIVENWITGDVRPGRGEEKWLNLILQKI